MDAPLIARELLAYLRLVHGGFNSIVLLLVLYQGWLGLTIRTARRLQRPLPSRQIRRHRKLGPILALLGPLGFLVGITLVLLDTGNLLTYPFHLLTGVVIVVVLTATYLVSRQIRGPEPRQRNRHFVLGLILLGLYPLEAFLGLGALL